jgi:inward rectifier potassium channel
VAAPSASGDGVVVVGVRAHPLRDAYLSLLKMRWSALLGSIACVYLAINFLFALAYVTAGGVHGARPGSLPDAFYFSVQTMGTVGYGALYPETHAANLLVVAESVVGLILTALATGIVFARFSQTTGLVVFSRRAVVSPFDGMPTLALRVGNDRASAIFDAQVRVTLTRTEKTKEGVTFYRMYDLPLVRDRAPALFRSFSVMHRIDDQSPMRTMSPRACAEQEVELLVSLVGTDDISLQPVHGRRRYLDRDIVWGARLADVLREREDGIVELDIRKFDEIVSTEATDGFPYPRKPLGPP